MKLSKFLYEATKPEASKSDPYGEYLFAPERMDAGEDIPFEMNTWQEDILKDALLRFYNNSDASKLEEYVPKILDLLAKNKYTALLDPGEHRIYRGISVSEEFLANILEPYGEEIQYDEYVVMNLPDQSKPLADKFLQSWTLNPATSAKFAIQRDKASIIFVARTNAEGNRFFVNGENNLEKVVGSMHSGEAETMSVGSVEYDGFAYYVSKNKRANAAKLVDAAKKVH